MVQSIKGALGHCISLLIRFVRHAQSGAEGFQRCLEHPDDTKVDCCTGWGKGGSAAIDTKAWSRRNHGLIVCICIKAWHCMSDRTIIYNPFYCPHRTKSDTSNSYNAMPKDYQQQKNQTFACMHCENVTITNAKVTFERWMNTIHRDWERFPTKWTQTR